MRVKVYYIDDESELCELFGELFAGPNAEITTFCNPLAALEAIQKNPPDLIFMDYRMPELNGIELAKKLDPTLKKYLMTGESGLKPDCHFDGVMSKPLDIVLIRKIISEYAAGN